MYSTQIPPSNIECESAVLGGILLDPKAIHRVVKILPEQAFYVQSHQTIYSACVALYERQEEVNLLSVTNWLQNNKQLTAVGGRSNLARIFDSCISSDNIEELADLISEKFIRRQLFSLSPKFEAHAQDTEKPLAWILEDLEQQILQITQLRNSKAKGYWNKIDDVAFEQLCKDLEEVEDIENSAQRDWAMRKLSKKWKFSSKKELLDFHAKWLDSRNVTTTYSAKEYFLKYGQSEQDWLIPGFVPNQSVIALYADGGVGKTRLAFTLAKHMVTGGDFAYEGTNSAPMNTLLIETDQGPRNTSKLLEMQDFLSENCAGRLTICDEWSANEFGKLRSMLRKHQSRLVIIDSLTSISVDSLYSEKEAEYARPLVRLRHIAKEFNCSFLVIHHANAGGDMRGSRAIRNTVDEVWKFTKTQSEIGDFNTLEIEKTRSRGPGKYKFNYDDETWGWKFVGRLEDSVMGDSTSQSTNNMQRCLQFLQKNKGIAFEAAEVAEVLGSNKDSIRRDLKRAAGEGLVNSGRSRRDKRAVVYYLGNRSDQCDQELITSLITSPFSQGEGSGRCDQKRPSDQPSDQFENKINSEQMAVMAVIDHIDLKPLQIAEKEVISEVITSKPTDHFSTELVQQAETAPVDKFACPPPVDMTYDPAANAELLKEALHDESWEMITELTEAWTAKFKKEVWLHLSEEERDAIKNMKPKEVLIFKDGILPVFVEKEQYFSVPHQVMVKIFMINDVIKECTCEIPIGKKVIRSDVKFHDLKAGAGSYFWELRPGDRVKICIGENAGKEATVSSQMPNQGPVFLKIDGMRASKSSKTPYWGHQIEKL
ncbi:DnaB-like helicase N-terminal domain-containing protein [Anabaena lutea]|uniref:AAA family ATPase n=1 Tax=Anabaena lutea FACHB-196 TaxID=2692881 RepID=A0ABR8FFD8_9NOST|nr:DnaB-like helicase N-terminal domain-containing protein [Anabaena lutea]MBD2568358.1 AAA family ATPase [Anabaena lutea FACHB-196]